MRDPGIGSDIHQDCPGDHPSDESPETEFTTDLEALVARACEKRADITGGYDVRTPGGDTPDVTVEVTELVKFTD